MLKNLCNFTTFSAYVATLTSEEFFSFNNTFHIIGHVRCPIHEKTHDI